MKTKKLDPAKKRRIKRLFRTFFRTLFLIFIFAAVIGTGGVLAVLFGWVDPAPDINPLDMTLNQTSYIYYVNDKGEEIEYEEIFGTDNRIWVDADDMPLSLKQAIVAIEDERFYNHIGVDLKSTSAAVWNFITRNPEGRGASTLTQQIIKNHTSDSDVSPARKVREILRAISLEHKMSKNDILELYLNLIYLGQGCSGVGSASNMYFDKDCRDLNLPESALLAGITQFPSRFDPIVNFESSKEKQEVVLMKMLELGMISQEEHDNAVAYELKISQIRRDQLIRQQSYFGDQVINEVVQDLMSNRGISEKTATNFVYSRGLKIYSTIDPEVQKIMENVYLDNRNFPTVRSGPQIESAMVVLDPASGAVKGVVGGRGEKTASRTLNRATQSLRQPGSAIKPISVYAPALHRNVLSPTSTYSDSAINIGGWRPKNSYAGFRGSMTVNNAIAQSVNTIAVRVLQQVGIENSFEFSKNKMGLTTLVDSRKNDDGSVYSDKNYPALSLGGLTDGVKIVDLAGAFAVFANRGVHNTPHTYTVVKDAHDDTILKKNTNTQISMNESAAAAMNSMLRSVVTGGTGTAANFRNDMDICGKTGTTDKDNDRWFAGYTPYYVGVVWTGFDQPKSVRPYSSGNPSIPVWKNVMTSLHRNKAGKFFDKVSVNAPTTAFCQDSEMLPNDYCASVSSGSRVLHQIFEPGKAPTTICNLHTQITVDTSTGMIVNDYCPQSTAAVMVVKRSGDGFLHDGSKIPNLVCTVHNPTNSGTTVAPPSPDASPTGGGAQESPSPTGGTTTTKPSPNSSTAQPMFNSDGTYYIRNSDGSYYYYKTDGSYFFYYPDGISHDFFSPGGGSYYFNGDRYYQFDR